MIKYKKYYKITFELASPMIIGSGNNEFTDNDVVKNSIGEPYIPASSVAGVTISAIKNYMRIGDRRIVSLFGKRPDFQEEGKRYTQNKKIFTELTESKVVFYDANIVKDSSVNSEDYYIGRRDCVALDEHKTAKSGSKFDMEVLETGARFVTYVEQNMYDDVDEEEDADEVADVWFSQLVKLGAKTMRGYGAIKNVEISKIKFDLSKEADKWLKFDMFDNEDKAGLWEPYQSAEEKRALLQQDYMRSVQLELELVSGISIRKYTTKIKSADFEQLTLHSYDNGNPVPVIPGTTWAGAFKHRMMEVLPEEAGGKCEDLFGYIKDNTGRKSKISFSESYIKGGVSKIVSRNAIDRFTGGTVEGKLFTEKMHYGGMTKLTISFTDKIDDVIIQALAGAILDLHNGFLAIGGETSIGRGLFKVKKIVIGQKVIEINGENKEENISDYTGFCKAFLNTLKMADVNEEGENNDNKQ